MEELRVELVKSVSEGLNEIAKGLLREGRFAEADTLIQQAASLQLASPELQLCWGGPFNGQTGRLQIIDQILRAVHPSLILETGTFRGISTEWLAERFTGRIRSCEKERLYYLQARERLGRFPQVEQAEEDSRQFLRSVLSSCGEHETVFIYLDAHWELDLPLRDELQIIFSSRPQAIVMVDDFRVPDDTGYSWDEYPGGRALRLQYIADVVPPRTRIYFPALSSRDETGARRGCCVLTHGSGLNIEGCDLLRGADLEDWLVQDRSGENGMPGATVQPLQPDVLCQDRGAVVENERSQRATPFEDPLSESELQRCQARLEEVNADRNVRLNSILTLTAEIGRLRAEIMELRQPREGL